MTARRTPSTPPATTEAHVRPETRASHDGRPVLLMCYPNKDVLPLEGGRLILGRDFLAARGRMDSKVSSAHCELSRRGQAWCVTDAGSRNGTWVDAVRLGRDETAVLGDGAVLRIGNTLLVYRESFDGPNGPMPPIGALTGPFGLGGVAVIMEAFRKYPPSAVLLEGETGTGKELAAAAIAAALGRAHKYGTVNVAALASGVFEAHLFGHVPGAYSGSARGGSPGIIGAHQGGAVFLDEIGELAPDAQAKLLRLVEHREVLPVGATGPSVVDVLLIAATNQPLDQMVESGAFRRDLLARFMSARLELPPLRERAEDLPAIAEALMSRRGWELDPSAIDIEAVERMMLAAWPANIRELAAVLDRVARLAAPGKLPLWAVEEVLGPYAVPRAAALTLARVQETLQRCGGNQSLAARELGITRGKLLRFLAANGG